MAFRQTNRTPAVLNKYEEVVRLRALGLSFQAIAERVGYAGRSGAREAYSQAIKMWGTEAVDELRVIENERLDHLQRTLMQKLDQTITDPETNVNDLTALVNSAINLSRRRSSLNGLDSASKHEISGLDGNPLQTDVGEMLRQRLEAFEKQTEIESAQV
jgi:hypothetical protein